MSYTSEQSKGKGASVFNFLFTITLAVLFLIYFSIMAYTKDALWFYPVFDGRPAAMSMNCYGEPVSVEPDSDEFNTIINMVNEQISGDKRWDQLSLRDETLQDYQLSTNMMVLELFYNEPQRIHSQSPFFSGFTSLLIPLDGRYADQNIMFALRNGKPSGGSFHLTSFEPTKEFIENSNLCVKP